MQEVIEPMLLPFWRKKPESRKFDYIPRVYDPDSEKKTGERIDFKQFLDGGRYRKRRTTSPFLYLVIIIVVILVIKYLASTTTPVEHVDTIQLNENEIMIFNSRDSLEFPSPDSILTTGETENPKQNSNPDNTTNE